MSNETIIVETKGRVGIIRLNRPQVLNALNKALVAELNAVAGAQVQVEALLARIEAVGE